MVGPASTAAEAGPRGGCRLRLLGLPRAEAAGTELRFPDRKCVAIVAVLALDGACTRARLADLLWDAQGDARRNLRRELHRLREAGFEAFVAAQGDVLALHDEVEVDVARFLAAGEGHGDSDAEQALALHGGALLEGFDLAGAEPFNDWLAAHRNALDSRWRALAEARAAALEAAGRLRAALDVARRLVEADTLQEAPYRRAMRLHAALGEREAALALYERCRRLLGRELGLRPLAETVALAEAVRSGRLPAPVAAAPAPQPAALPALQTLAGPAPLVGREALVARLDAALAGRLTVLRGAAGIGKTALLAALAARRPGLVRLGTRLSDRRVPYAALARWLRDAAGTPMPAWVRPELARLLPEFGAAPAPIETDAQRLRFFSAIGEAWRQLFGDQRPLAFDDWQFVDDASAMWWGWWFGRSEAPVLVAERPGEAGALAATTLQEAASGGATVVDVPPLEEAAMRELVARLSGSASPRRFAHRLWQATGGHAFYALETLQHLLQCEVIRVDAQGLWSTPFDDATTDYHELPIAPSVQAAVLQRLRALDEATQRLLEAASLADDDFALELLARASALDEWEAVRALECALHARVLVRVNALPAASGASRPPGRFRFEHDLFAQAVAAALSPERRALLHRALAQALAAEGAAAARVAAHFDAAGDAAAARAWHFRALERARERHLPADTLAHAERVLALAPRAEERVQAQLARASALYMRADPAGARAALDAALAALGPNPPLAQRVDVVAMQAFQAQREGRAAEMLPALDALLAEPALDTPDRARLLMRRGTAGRVLGRLDAARADLQAARALLGDEPARQLAQVLEDLARLSISAGDLDACRRHAEQAAAVARAAETPALESGALMLTGVAEQLNGHFEASLPWLLNAREVARQHGLVASERAAILNLVSTWLALGRRPEALQAVEEGWALSPLFSSLSEQQAFVEARYQCRVDNGELGAALQAREDLVAASLRAVDHDRRASGLMVALDLPLALDDAQGAHDAAQALANACPAGSVYAAMAHAKRAWWATVAGQPALAQAELAAARALPPTRPEAQAYLRLAALKAAQAAGDAAACQAAADGLSAAGISTELWAQLLAAALAGPEPGCWHQPARQALAETALPPLPALLLADALGDAAAARPLAGRLHASLAGHPREQALFERRFARWR